MKMGFISIYIPVHALLQPLVLGIEGVRNNVEKLQMFRVAGGM